MNYNCWSTLHIPPKLRADFWRDASERVNTPITPHIPSPALFDAKLTTRGIGDLALNHVQVLTSHDVESTRADLSRTHQPCFLVEMYTLGAANVTQRGRAFQATLGQPYLLDGRKEYRLDHSQPVSMLALAVPFVALGRREVSVEALTARQQPKNVALHVLAAQMRCLSTWPFALEPSESNRLSDLLVGAVQAVLDGSMEGESKGALQERDFLRRRIQQLIEQMYADSSLSPLVVATKMGISVRSLHARLARDGASFSAELLAYRLQRSYNLLRAARFSEVTIREIGFRCGFVSASHFSRSFRSRFGVSPSEVMRNG